MKQARQRDTLRKIVSQTELINAVVLILFTGTLTWALNTYAWPLVEPPARYMLADSNLLVGAVVAVAFLILKEFCGLGKSLTLAVNALAIVVSLGYLALYMSVNVAALLVATS